jgi:hypothetical protein
MVKPYAIVDRRRKFVVKRQAAGYTQDDSSSIT